MKFILTLALKDHINYQLYYFSTTDTALKRRKKNGLILSLAFCILGLLQYMINNIPEAIFFITLGIIYLYMHGFTILF